MYNDRIDSLFDKTIEINDELRSLIREIIKDIFAVDPDKTKHTINVEYYISEYITDDYRFFGLDGDGYGVSLSISSINVSENDEPWLGMTDEDGDEYDERSLGDFATTELLYIVRMLDRILEFVKKEGSVNSDMDLED